MPIDAAVFARHIRPLSPLPTGVQPRLPRIEPCGALLFDVYGTLLVSAAGDIGAGGDDGYGNGALADLLRRHGLDRAPDSLRPDLHAAIERAHAQLRQRGVDYPEVDIVRIWQALLGLEGRRRAADFALEVELIVNPVYPMPGLKVLLAACRENGVPLGIVSNAQFYTPLVLEWFLGSPPEKCGFDPRLLFYSYRWGRAKPSRFMFERAAEALSGRGISPGEALYVGNDMRNDILPAAAVGFKTALFAGDRRSLRLRDNDRRCRDLSPDLIVTDLRQLAAAVGRRACQACGPKKVTP